MWLCLGQVSASVTNFLLFLGLLLLLMPSVVRIWRFIANSRLIAAVGAILVMLAALRMLGLLPCFI